VRSFPTFSDSVAATFQSMAMHSIDSTDSDLVAFLVDVHTNNRTSLLPELQRQLTAYSLPGSRDQNDFSL
jgi:hypothetical protein